MGEIAKAGPEEINAVLTKMAAEKIRPQSYGGTQHNLNTVWDNRAVVFILGTVMFFANMVCRASEGVLSRGFFIWISESMTNQRTLYKFDDKEDSIDLDENGAVKRRYAVTQKSKQDRGIEYYNNCK